MKTANAWVFYKEVAMFVTIKTADNGRKVTIQYDKSGAYLLGTLKHNTRLVIDQKLVDDLQKVVNTQKEV
jgi:hypothetical protein